MYVHACVCVCVYGGLRWGTEYVHKACEGPHERAVKPPFILKGLFGSYDTFTYSPEQKSFPFISVHALRKISEIHFSRFEVLLPGDALLGRCTELI